MKLFVISDTHGKIEKAIEIYKALRDVDFIVHLGDNAIDAHRLKTQLGVEVIGVKGNMDGAYSEVEYKILETEYGKIFITHGHMENVKFSLEKLLYKTDALDCRAALFGHTHIPVVKEVEGIHLINPGSLTLPAGGRKGSYAIINTTNSSFETSLVYTDIKQISKISHGMLSNLLNESDKF